MLENTYFMLSNVFTKIVTSVMSKNVEPEGASDYNVAKRCVLDK